MVNERKTAPLELWYKRIARISVGAVLFLILVGGIVRSTGSGMGCPDWPTCFGLMVPPSSVDEIPQAFFEKHPDYESKTFDAFQTWTEYVNRLVGATIGLLMFLTTLFSLTFFRRDIRIFLLSLVAMLLTGFEGWLGKLVVDRNLAGGMVTLHLLVALIIVALLIVANYLVALRHREAGTQHESSPQLTWIGFGVVALILAQILIGTQVRESVDEAAKHLGEMKRDGWLQGSVYYSIHKVLWMVMAGLAAFWIFKVWKANSGDRTVRLLAVAFLACIVLEIVFGVVLSNFDLPPVIQPLHMLFANLIFAAAFSIWIRGFGGGTRLVEN